MIVIYQGGQTGVDRGAWRAAKEAGAERNGWMPHDMRDDLGPIPPEVADDLHQHSRGLAARNRANVRDCDAIVLVVRDIRRPDATRGTALTMRLARELRRDWIATDGSAATIPGVVAFVGFMLESEADVGRRALRLMVAGPRASSWPEGEETARRVVCAILESTRAGYPSHT